MKNPFQVIKDPEGYSAIILRPDFHIDELNKLKTIQQEGIEIKTDIDFEYDEHESDPRYTIFHLCSYLNIKPHSDAVYESVYTWRNTDAKKGHYKFQAYHCIESDTQLEEISVPYPIHTQLQCDTLWNLFINHLIYKSI